jgi:hypothetical protein
MQTQSSNAQSHLSHLFAEGLLFQSNPPKPTDPPDHDGGGTKSTTSTPSAPPPPKEPTDAQGKLEE